MTNLQEFDRIESEMTIVAPLLHVWELAKEPGWWINDGTIISHHLEAVGPDYVIVNDPDHGRFSVALVDQQPQEYAAYRWYSGPSESRRTGELSEDTSTLVEFFLTAVDPTTTKLRVVESGFAQLDEEARRRRKMFDENTEGWALELAAAGRHLEGALR